MPEEEVQWLFDLPFLIFGIRLGVLWPNENPCVRVAQMDLFYIYISRTVSFLYEVKGKIINRWYGNATTRSSTTSFFCLPISQTFLNFAEF